MGPVDPEGDDRSRIAAEAIEILAAEYFPEEIRESTGHGAVDAPGPYGITPLQARALDQAGLTPTDIAVAVQKAELAHLKSELKRLERTLSTHREESVSESRVVAVVFLVLGALGVMVLLLNFVSS